MFSLREYLTNLFTNPAGAVDEVKVNDAIQTVYAACLSDWAQGLRLSEILRQLAL